MTFQPRSAEDQKNRATGKGMAVRPAVESAHYMFLDKYGKQAFKTIQASRSVLRQRQDKQTHGAADPPYDISHFPGTYILRGCSRKTQEKN